MKKIISIIAILLTLGTVALFVLNLLQDGAAESRPTVPVSESEPTGTTAPEASEYTFPPDQPLPSGTQPAESSGDASVPTAAPGLAEDETPHMEV